MELTREQTIKVIACCNSDMCEVCALYDYTNCVELRDKNIIHYLKEKEPAPAATETSSEVSPNDTDNISHLDDSTSKRICQAIKDGIEMIKHDSVIAFSGEMPINDYIARLAEIHGICEIIEKGTIYAQGDK